MANAFERTLRSLEADSSRRLQVTVAVVVALLVAWSVWFVTATFSQRAVSDSLTVRGGVVVARFELGVTGRIREGQAASLRVDAARVAARVVGVAIEDGAVRVELEPNISLRDGAIVTRAIVEIGTQTPAEMLGRALAELGEP